MNKIFLIGNQICEMERTQFADGESKFTINKHNNAKKQFFKLICDSLEFNLEESGAVLSKILSDKEAIVDLCLMLNALSYDDSVKSIYLIIPYMAYARQDRQNAEGECISVIAVLRMILAQTNKIKSISFCDIHNPAIFKELPSDITYKNIYPHIQLDYTGAFIAKMGDKYDDITLHNTTFVACDAGGATRARIFNKAMGMKNNIAIINKTRKEDGEVEMSTILGETVQDRLCVIVEDIVDSAGTLCKSAELLKENGATKIYAFITHGIFSGNAIEKINNSYIEKIFVTDSHPFDSKGSKKIENVCIPCITSPIWFN